MGPACGVHVAAPGLLLQSAPRGRAAAATSFFRSHRREGPLARESDRRTLTGQPACPSSREPHACGGAACFAL